MIVILLLLSIPYITGIVNTNLQGVRKEATPNGMTRNFYNVKVLGFTINEFLVVVVNLEATPTFIHRVGPTDFAIHSSKPVTRGGIESTRPYS